MKWTQQAWKSSEQIYNRIISHPFITELMNGTLATERFVRYIAQDEIYIKNYGEEMYLLADMLPAGEMQQMFREFADGGIEAEKQMHALLIDRFGIDTKVAPSSVTTDYMNHTRKFIESKDLKMSMAAMLPCMWIYNRVGLYIFANSKFENNPYAEWIATYLSEEFTKGVEAFVEMCDQLSADATDSQLTAMTEAYDRAAYLEWAFWDYGYNG